MEFKYHLFVGLIVFLSLVNFFEFSITTGLIISLSSILIDIDHYFWYALSSKKWNPFDAIRWYNSSLKKRLKLSQKEKKDYKKGVFVFHSIFFMALFIILSLFHKFFLWVFIGIAIHLFFDILVLIYYKEPLYPKLFPYYTLIRNKNKKPITNL